MPVGARLKLQERFQRLQLLTSLLDDRAATSQDIVLGGWALVVLTAPDKVPDDRDGDASDHHTRRIVHGVGSDWVEEREAEERGDE